MAYNRVSPYKTKIARDGEAVRVIYHSTMIVHAGPSFLRLDTGGWRTVTTKRKMNQAANQFGLGFTVFQRDHDWFFTTKAGEFAWGDDRVIVIDRASGLPLLPELHYLAA